MKRFLPLLLLFISAASFAQENPPTNQNLVGSTNNDWTALKGERQEFTQYYDRARKLIIDSALVSYQGPNGIQKANVWPTQTNPYWRDVGSFYPFSGKANVIGCKIGYQSWKQNGTKADLYSIDLFQEAEEGSGKPEEILATESFFAYQISTGPDLDSFTTILFNSSQFTQVERGFLVTVAMENISPEADDLDIVRIYSSSRGDGRGEMRSMARLSASSDLYNGKDYIKLDEAFLTGSGAPQPFQWNWDVMIIPIMDIDEVGIGHVNLPGARFNGHFPNPARDRFTLDIDLQEQKENLKISVQTMSGQTVTTTNTGSLGIGKHFLAVDIVGLTAGSYIYTVDDGNGARFSGRVIVVD